ncbi:dolichol-phosphate mannose synthase subunit 3-like isoform X1 [Cucurbita moschata]|uniref:Dolichol-phosphate mannosyltransferase subunit 3 n=3 Tax=Cucurbita TaxID=3660 RepID=A0A6J1FP02_CUCMO|nr:dolichol-phosphate mannose synthase subunit 3-like isoform X1 [Cucurbita moschata]
MTVEAYFEICVDQQENYHEIRFWHYFSHHQSMKHIVKILTLLMAISALWIGLLQTSILPHGHAWLLPIYFIVSLGCYGLLMVGVGLMTFPTCPREGLLLQQDIDEAKEHLKQKGIDINSN